MATIIENNTPGSTEQAVKEGSSMSFIPKKYSLRLHEYLFICLEHWYWFVISIVICMTCGYIYYKKSTPVYATSASILIKTDSQGRSVSGTDAMFEDLGITSTNNSLNDEVQIIQSPDLMRDVVRKLNLQVSYTAKGNFRPIDLYGSTLPVQVSMPDVKEDASASFKLSISQNGDYVMSDMRLDGQTPKGPAVVKGRIGTPARTPLGIIEITPGKGFENSGFTEFTVSHTPMKATVGRFVGSLNVTTDERSWNLVNLRITDTSSERAADVLTQLIGSYNDRWMRDKRTLADNSSKFIDERVQLIQNELGSVDNDISSFKSANMVPDVDAAASLYMSQASQASMALKDLRNQEYMAKYIRTYLRNSENNNKLLPTNAGINSPSLSGQITQYNTKILERNSLVAQSSASNPLVADMDAALSAMRGALIASIDNELVSLNEQIRSQEGFTGTAQSKIASNPKQAKYLLSVERQQKVKETLYLYLLQKREENQLNQAFTSYNTRIVREPDGSNVPISPNRTNILLISFAIGLIVPALVLYQQELSVHVVRGRRDIADMKIPLAGELPLHSRKQKLKKYNPNNKKSPRAIVAVKENSRNSVNEAFRVLRTNLEFMIANDPKSKVIMLTSFNPGSGKTFVAYNVAKSFAIKGKKVIVIDLDMRKASLSKYIEDNKIGISDYLANRVNDITKIIHKVEDTPNMALIPVGTVPPNPTELLFSERLHALITDLRMHYDYIFIDCPPAEVVADASIISKFTDMTLFIIRAGVLDLSMLPLIDDMYSKKTYPNMSLVLNGTINPRNSYARRYGNPYSYGYGYGSGYSYTNED